MQYIYIQLPFPLLTVLYVSFTAGLGPKVAVMCLTHFVLLKPDLAVPQKTDANACQD